MRALKLVLLLMPFLLLEVSAQLIHPDAVKFRTGFFNNYHTNPDSAIIYARKLSSDTVYTSFLRQAIHQDVFMYFSDEIKQKFRAQGLKDKDSNWRKKYDEFLRPIYTTLYKMSIDSDPILSNTAKPIYLWANIHKIKQNMNDAEELKKRGTVGIQSSGNKKEGMDINSPAGLAASAKTRELVQAFIVAERTQKDLHQDNMGTYALLMYQDIAQDKSMTSLADELLTITMNCTLSAVQNIKVNTASDSEIKKRAYNRYIYATANYFKGNSLVKAGNPNAAALFYKAAAEYSPDLTDLGEVNEFSTEVYFFGNKQKEFFQTAYVDYLNRFGDKGQMLLALTQMALRNPVDHKEELKSFYTANFDQQESFSAYWRTAINRGLIKAPIVQIQKIDGTNYSSAEKIGKWILVDFWGTWCGPCRIEHPALEQLYVKSRSVPSANLDIITIACNDTKEKVLSYMKEFHYTYPVAMNDKEITKAYNVRGYPTKALITPEGNYIIIPFNCDWIKFIERYTD